MQRIDLFEYKIAPNVRLEPTVAAELHRPPALTVVPSRRLPDSWDVQAAQFVGIVQAGDVEVRIHPKVGVERLLFLLAFAADPSGWKELEANFGQAVDLVSAIAHGFVHHSERALSRGPLQGYVTREEALPGLRGRLREADQLRVRFGIPVPVEVRYDDLTIDIPENRILKSAARRLLRFSQLRPTVHRRLAHLLARLDGVSQFVPGEPVPDVVFTRRNAPYRSAVVLGQLILRSMSIDEASGSASSVTFLFDMNKVFEDFVTTALGSELERIRGTVRAQLPSHLDEANRIRIRPDLMWWERQRCLAVIDAKYKSLGIQEFPNADLYQALAYCTAFGLDVGYLVYAAGNEKPAVHAVRSSGVSLVVYTLALDQPPGALLESVRGLAKQIGTLATLQRAA